MPLDFPPDWVYESAFGKNYQADITGRTENSPLNTLENIDLTAERDKLKALIRREPTEEEFVLYLNHPGDALKTFEFTAKYSDPNNLPVDVWFEGLQIGTQMGFRDTSGKPHQMVILDISPPKETGDCVVRYLCDSEIFIHKVKVKEAMGIGTESIEMADPSNICHIAAPSNGDLWVMYAHEGDIIQKGQELFNISIMKQEKAVLSPIDGIVKRILKRSNYQETKKMIPVVNGELLVEISPTSDTCVNCKTPLIWITKNSALCVGTKSVAVSKKIRGCL
ncbi:MAG: hypothetical protein MI799_18540 [Desulfobacterales bacterium]|nr:hypothetical protein [Desulfobacterales bacterium]